MRSRALIALLILLPAVLAAQSPPAAAPTPPAPPPATKLEAFRPSAGTIVTMGYDELGRVGAISVDVRDNRGVGGASARGVVVDVQQGEYRQERAFVDADEIPELIKGIDALLDVKANPTKFQNFEVRYKTKGELEIVAFNNKAGRISYVLRVGRVTTASAYNLDPDDVRKLRAMFVTAQERLGSS